MRAAPPALGLVVSGAGLPHSGKVSVLKDLKLIGVKEIEAAEIPGYSSVFKAGPYLMCRNYVLDEPKVRT